MSTNSYSAGSLWNWLALIAAAIGTAGSLYLSIGMDLIPCPLCCYQRTFVLCTLGVLLIGLATGAARGPALSLIALALSVGGLGVAGYQVYLEQAGKLVCPKGVQDIGTGPQQSLALFAILTLFLLVDLCKACCGSSASGEGRTGGLFIVTAFLLGLLLAGACIKSTPPLPLDRNSPNFDKICHPPAETK